MHKQVRASPGAEEELTAAARWYEGRRAGLGAEFIAAADLAVSQIRELPSSGSPVRNVPPELGIRQLQVQRFPYAVVFMDLRAETYILAFAHTRRAPGYWRGRLT